VTRVPERINALFHRLTGPLLLSMILLSVAHGFDPEIPRLFAGIAAWLAGVILWPGVKGLARLQILAMLGVGAVALAWAASMGQAMDWESVLASNQALLSMLAAVSFLRLVTLPASAADERAPRGPAALRSTLLGVHLFGSVINLSALMIIGDRLSAQRPLTQAQALVLSRGFAMAANWSPFFAAMGVALTNAPGAQLPTLALFGLPVAALALGYTAVELGRRPEVNAFTGYPLHFGALWIPALLALLVLLIHQWRPQVPILSLVSALSLTVTLVVVLARDAIGGMQRFAAFTRTGLPRMANELALFLAAGVLATGIAAAVAVSGITIGGGSFGALEAAGLLIGMVLLSALGIHPVISIATAGGLLAPLHPDPNLLGMVFLMTWALGVTLSPFSGMHLAMQGRYGIDSHLFLGWNWRFALVVLGVDLAALFAYSALVLN
jgi:hypothetical protein